MKIYVMVVMERVVKPSIFKISYEDENELSELLVIGLCWT